jgi:3-isopropylmalate/(R)-2-methylmalate dehydratase small subunit
MDALVTHTGTGLPLRRSNVDTDQIIPAVYLKRITRTGFEDGLFSAWKNDPAFVANNPVYTGASVLVAGPDFGTGSSREHAVWALQDGGFAVVLSPRFGPIFRINAGKSGLLAGQIDQSVADALWDLIEADPSTPVTVDLETRTVTAGTGDHAVHATFGVDDYTRYRLLNGLDDIAITLQYTDAISVYEASRPSWKPSTQDVPTPR